VCRDGVLQVVVPRMVPAHQRLPSSVSYYLSTDHTRGGAHCHQLITREWLQKVYFFLRVLVDHFLSIEDLCSTGEHHAPWPGNTLNLVIWGLGDAQLEQIMKMCGNSWGFLFIGANL
jgi:hypothetical protein